MTIAKTQYADAFGVKIAYQVFGRGLVDLLLIPGFVSHVGIAWEEPLFARFLTKLGSLGRVIFFDKRGTPNGRARNRRAWRPPARALALEREGQVVEGSGGAGSSRVSASTFDQGEGVGYGGRVRDAR